MDIVIDTSALIAVIVAEPEKREIVKKTTGHTLIGPGSIPWEIGNAFTAMLKQRRVDVVDAQKGIEIFDSIPLRYVNVDMENAMVIAGQTNTYAYDAYFLDCALRHSAPLLTLDAYLKQVAGKIGIAILEV
jgi:predicted nucleic acid-binding protein